MTSNFDISQSGPQDGERRCLEAGSRDARRYLGYRLLARFLLGPNAPTSDAGLTRALAERARQLRSG
jgi:hypothetical protein